MKKDLIIQHYKKPNNWGELSQGISCKAENSSCGDSVEVSLKVEDEVLKDAKFKGTGCSICLGTADIFIDEIKGKNIKEVQNINEDFMLKLIEMDANSPRKTCAILCLQAVTSSLKDVK